jgi:hypothetical protein
LQEMNRVVGVSWPPALSLVALDYLFDAFFCELLVCVPALVSRRPRHSGSSSLLESCVLFKGTAVHAKIGVLQQLLLHERTEGR